MSLQRTPEWYAARLGKLGASQVADALARTKTGWGASRGNLIALLVCERLTGVQEQGYVSGAMQHGIDTEAQARAAYEFHTDNDVELCGFIDHPAIRMSGASPDGLVGDKTLVEIKCPGSSKHIQTLLGAPIDGRYRMQMQWQMACTDRDICDFVSFDNRLSPEMQIHISVVSRDDKMIAELEREVAIFLDEVAATVDKLRTAYALKGQLTASLAEAAA